MLRALGYALLALFIFCIAGLVLSGCYTVPRAPRLGAALPTAEQVSTCKRELAVRNVATVLGGAFSGSAGATGAAAADIHVDSPAKIPMEVTAITLAAAGVAMVITGGVEANNWGANYCDTVLRPLP